MRKFKMYSKINEVEEGSLYNKIMSSNQGLAISDLFSLEYVYNHNVLDLYGDCISLEEVYKAIAKDFEVDIVMVKYIFKICTCYDSIDKIEAYFRKPYGNRYKDIQVIKGDFFSCLFHDLENSHSITEDKTVKRIYFYKDFNGKMKRLKV